MKIKKAYARRLLLPTLHEAGQILTRMSEHIVGDGYLEIRHPYMTKESMSNYAFVVYSKITKGNRKKSKSSGEDLNHTQKK